MTSWPQLRGQHPKGADRQAEPTQRGREGYPWDFLLLFMPLIGGTIWVLWRSVREYLVPNGRLLASTSCSAPRACCPTSGSHSERPRGSPLRLSVVVHAPHGWHNPGVSSERARVCGPQWAALGFGTVVRAPGVLPPTSGSHSEPYTAAGVTPWTFSFVDCYRIDHN